jgi:hypothetical protein
MNPYQYSYEANKYLETEVFPHLTNNVKYFTACNFLNYLCAFYKKPISPESVMEKVNYYEPNIYFGLDFLKKYEDKCVGFCTMSNENISRFGRVRAIYQLTPKLHLQLGIAIAETAEEKLNGLLVSLMFAAENVEDAINFVKENEDLIIKDDPTKESSKFSGFKI